MDGVTRVTGGRRRRRVVAAAAGAVGLFLCLASVAYACTVLQGTLTVCDPAQTGYTEIECWKSVAALGTRTETYPTGEGASTIVNTGEDISIVGTGFFGSPTAYSITFARPGVLGLNCHFHNPDGGVTSLLGTSGPLNLPNTVSGPNFDVGNGTGTYATVTTPNFSSASTNTGQARICVQDEPARVDGNAVTVNVVA